MPELAYKPDSVPLRAVVIYLERWLPNISMQPTREVRLLRRGRGSRPALAGLSSLLGLAPGGGCLAISVARYAGGLLHLLFTLTGSLGDLGRFVSVALSTGYPVRVLPGTVP
jgi:hypothetical protein